MMRIFLGVVGLIAFWVSQAIAQTPPPIEAFGRLPAVSDAAISPDGTRVALAMSQGSREFVSVVHLDERRSLYSANVSEGTQLRGVGWADDQRVTFIVSRTFAPHQVLPSGWRFRGRPRRVDYWRSGVIDLASQSVRLLSTSVEDEWRDSGAALIAPIEGEQGVGRMIGGGDRTERLSVYSIDLSNGRARPLSTNGAVDDTVQFILDERGAVVARVDVDSTVNRWRIFAYDNAQPRLLMEGESETGAPPPVVGITQDARLAMLDDEAGYNQLYAINRATAAREVLFAHESAEVIDAIADPWHRRIVGAVWGENTQAFFTPDLQSAYEALQAEFGGGGVSIVSWSRDRSRILVYGDRGLDGGGFYLFTPASSALQLIALRYPDLANGGSGERQSITYRARDGERIPAYLTLPSGGERRGLPLVVLVHGGPHGSRDTFGFDYEASFLASRGYAVLQANYRGSGGYGDAWESAGYRQWGALMQTDVEDGVTALERSAIIDPRRVCIVGGSYGGYAALAGATLTPERYRCSVSIAGVSDLPEMLRVVEGRGGREGIVTDYWRRSIGDRQEDAERIRAVSPVFLADRVQIPILLLHGTDDTVVPVDQSRRMQRALQAAGKNVRYVELRGDDHWLSDADTRIQVLREMETFLAAHIGPPQ